MAFALVITAFGRTTDHTNVTSDSVDTTGANLLVACMTGEGGGSPSISDSKSNTWTPLTLVRDNSSTRHVGFFWCVPTSVGASHTFTGVCTNNYPSIHAWAFSGADTSPYVTETGHTQTSGGTNAPGSQTPATNGNLLVIGSNTQTGGTMSVDSGFIESLEGPETANADGIHGAYLIQTTAAAVNPVVTVSSAAIFATQMLQFKAAAAAASLVAKAVHLRQAVNRAATY